MILTSGLAFAQEAAHGAASSGGSDSTVWYAIAAAATMSIASAFGALSQSKAAATALEAIGRNPSAAGKIQTPMIIALALIESLVIYGLVIAYLIQTRIPTLG
ncbi:MAG: ATP synthase F0 subunit C [Deltaproteobacteria bacterium]|nr:ATP synthase F0 subunit C [Deltaproteobacteria bacterium]